MRDSQAYYNEIDPFAAQWLRNLIAASHIAPGDVDERDICDVRPDELAGYSQCHFFAGIGGWSYALRLAGWPDDRPVWTGSCPCPPFSSAGPTFRCPCCDTPSPVPNALRTGAFNCVRCDHEWQADERHLWPEFHRLIRECRPDIVFGEQVASKDGRTWLDVVQAGLEITGYASWASDCPAASVGAPHIRQRLWWVADTLRGGAEHGSREGLGAEAAANGKDGRLSGQRLRLGVEGTACGLANAHGRDAGTEGLQRSGEHGQFAQDGGSGSVVDATSEQVGLSGRARLAGSTAGELVNSNQEQCYGSLEVREPAIRGSGDSWTNPDWLPCRDGKARPVEPGTFPLAHGIPGRVGRLRAYGNAIVPQVAAEFIDAYLEAREVLQMQEAA